MRSTMAEGSGEGTVPTVPGEPEAKQPFFKEAEVGCFVPERNQPPSAKPMASTIT